MDSKKFEAGTSLAHFRILSWIGAGGMGDVYIAEDARLGRKIALKVLPLSVANDPSRLGRFELEGRAASALNHPNILTIHDAGRSGDHYFIATELIEGVTLRSHLSRGAMKLPDVLDIATQIASALTAAHGAGIVHRDIKPENIMLRPDGYVKVLDFGLAKLTDRSTDGESASGDGATVHRATDPGTVVGTVNYMSPEQAQGAAVDARSDIFSVGVVLYEMITGRVPFDGATRSHIIVSILEKNPASLERVSGIPHELHRIVHKALEKNRDERYQVIKDLLLDLKALRRELEHSASTERDVEEAHQSAITIAPASHSLATNLSAGAPRTISSAEYIVGAITRRRKGVAISAAVVLAIVVGILAFPMFTREAEAAQRMPIAVADFDNQTGEAELNALSGMLITSLEQSRRLAVVTRSRMLDALKLMGREGVTKIDERVGREICARENVDALVTASIQKFGELYIVDLKVIDTTKNEYIFAAKEEGRGKEDIPRMLDRLSERLRLGLKEREHEMVTTKGGVAAATTVNLEAYQHFFRGEELVQHLKLDEAVVELRKAVALDPSFVQAQYRLAYVLGWDGLAEAKVVTNNAFKYIHKAPWKEQLLLRAMKAENEGRLDEAIRLWRQVLRRYPEEKEVIYILGDYLYHQGNFAAAKESLEKVLAIDPRFTRAHQHLIWTLRDMGNVAAMVAAAERFARIEQSEPSSINIVDAYAATGREGEALELSRRAAVQFPDSASIRGQRILLLEFLADTEKAQAELSAWEGENTSKREHAFVLSVQAMSEAYHGRYRRAIERMEKARETASEAGSETDANCYVIQKALLTSWSGATQEQRAAMRSASEAVAANATYSGTRALFENYLVTGDFEKARELTHRSLWGNPATLAAVEGEKELRAGNFGSAVARFEEALKGGYDTGLLHNLATAQMALGNSDAALAAIGRAVGPQPLGSARDLESWIYFHPRSLLVQGKMQEARGDREAAKRSYSRFLALWKDADPNLKEPAEARARMAKL